MERLKAVLSGYKHHDLPNLAGRRFPPGVVHTVVSSLPSPYTQTLGYGIYDKISQAIISASVARILGAYSDTTDVLLGIALDDNHSIRPVRVSLGLQRTWKDTIFEIANALVDPTWPSISPSSLDQLLGEGSSPPIVCFSSHLDGLSAPCTPLTLAIHSSELSISLTVSDRLMHKTVAEMFLTQVKAAYENALKQFSSPISSIGDLPNDVKSIYEKVPVEERKNLSSIPYVRFATDYLTLRANDSPHLTAVRWYPHLAPDLPSATFRPDTITYSEWNKLANQVGRWLLRQGLQREDRVAVCMERSIPFHVVFIAILRAGGCYVPIDPELPQERQLYIARDSGARFVIVGRHSPSFAFFGQKSLDIDGPSEREAITAESDLDLNLAQDDGLSYLLYTSGTTGNPKGCLLTHNGLAEAIWALSDVCTHASIEDPSQGNYLSVASIAFDVHIPEIMVPIANRLPILVAPRSELFEDLPHYVKEFKVSHLGIVPSLIEATMGTVEVGKQSGQISSLRYVASGGEKMSDAILDKWANHPTIRLANFYGPSEVTIGCAARLMNRVTPRENIGRPFANVSAYVVDENMSIVLRGTPGELVVEGPLVGRGYLNRPDLTEKVFLEFPEKSKGRWAYRTGDLVRMMPDSTLEILGRIDHQIKLRGVRIESEGISSIIRRASLAGVTLDVVTILAKHPAIASEQLVSFFSWDASVPIGRRKTELPSLVDPPVGLMARIRSACDKELATYMRPSHILPIGWIPLNANGKTDSKALGQWFMNLPVEELTQSGQTRHPASTDAAPSVSEIEGPIMEIIMKLFNVPENMLSVSSSLFTFGLDSMGAIQLSSELKKSLSLTISPADILTHPTIHSILGQVNAHRQQEKSPIAHPSFVEQFSTEWLDVARSALPSVRVVQVLPAFPLQEGVLFRSVGSSTMYVQHVLTRCRDGTSIAKLRDAWKNVMAKHDILRTVFYFGRDLVQAILHVDDVCVPWSENGTDFNDDSFREGFETGDALVIASNINSSLSSTPAFRLSLYTSIDGTNYLVLSIHHALFDGSSLPVLLEDVENEYLQNTQITFPKVGELLDRLHALDSSNAQRFWTDHFSGFDWQELHFKSPSTTVATITSSPFVAPLSTWKSKASTCNVTLQTVLTCAYGYLAATRLYDRSDVSFGVIRNGRLLDVEGVDVAMCPMITVLPCRLDFASLEDVLLRAQKSTSEAVEYEHIPLSRIHRWVGSEQGLFDTLFSVSFRDNSKSSLWDVISSQNPQPEYILAVEVVLDTETDTITVNAAYTGDDISSGVVEGIVGDLEKTSSQICSGNVQEPLHVIPRVPPRVPRAYLNGINEDEFTSLTKPSDETVEHVRDIASDFLRLDPALLLDTTSLMTFGLDSIRSVGLSRALQSKGFHISSISIMRHPTLLGIASRLSQELQESIPSVENPSTVSFKAECQTVRDAIAESEIKLSSDDRVEVFPTTTLQAGMLSQTVNSAGRRYMHLFPLRLKQGVVIELLRRAWEKVVESSSVLRTSFRFMDDLGTWVQIIHSVPDLKWSEDEVPSAWSTGSWFENFLSSFDWDNDAGCLQRPPLYLHLVQGPDSPLLLLSMHHALYDGSSIAMLLQAVEDAYYGEQSPTVAAFVDLLPHILWQERHGTQYFLRLLEDANPNPLPRVKTPSDRTILAKHEIVINSLLVDDVRSRAGVTLQCLGQAAFAQLLALLTKSKDVVFGHVVSGRSIPGAEAVLGPVLSTVPFRVRLDATQSNHDLLFVVHRNNIDALPWQHASLRALQRAKGTDSLWDSLFVFQPESEKSTKEPLWAFEQTDELTEVSTQYALNLELHKTINGFTVQAACKADAMTEEELKKALLEFERLLRNIVAFPEQSSCEDIPMFAPVHVETPPITPTTPTIPVPQIGYNFDALNNLLSSLARVSIEHIHAETSLVALGIDSITAIQVASKARQLGFALRAQDVVQSRTVADLYLKCLQSNQTTKPTLHDEAVFEITGEEERSLRSTLQGTFSSPESPIEGIFIASPGIKWLAGAWQKSHGSRFQHAFAYRLPSNVTVAQVRQAWSELLHKHAILRSTITSTSDSGQPRIAVFKPVSVLTELSWSETPLADTTPLRDQVVEHMKELVSHPPSLRRPPTRARFYSSSEENFLVLYMNHFQYDAWSIQLLIDDLAHSIRGDQITTSDAKLSAWLRASVPNSDTLREQEAYWKSAFPRPYEAAYFPSLVNPPDPNSTNRIVFTKLDTLLHASALEVRARELDVSLPTLLLAAWAKLQAIYTKNDAVTFGLWHAGRSGTMPAGDVDRLAVPCMNVLPLHVPHNAGDDILRVASSIQDVLRKRTPIIEQTDLESVDGWVGGGGKPLCNVYVNIVKVAPEVSTKEDGLLRGVEVPYMIPDVIDTQEDVIRKLSITDLIQVSVFQSIRPRHMLTAGKDDIMIDILITANDTVGMSIEVSSQILDINGAADLVEKWGELIKEGLQV